MIQPTIFQNFTWNGLNLTYIIMKNWQKVGVKVKNATSNDCFSLDIPQNTDKSASFISYMYPVPIHLPVIVFIGSF